MPDTPLPSPPRSDRSRIAPTDADRERAAALLSSRFADDVLSLEQFEQRVAEVFRAASRAELDALVADLAPSPAVESAATQRGARSRAVCGHIAITLPAGTQLEQHASSILASVECAPSPPGWPRQDAPVVRLTGRAVLSAVEILFGEPAPSSSGAAGIFPRVDRPRRGP